MMKKTVVVAFVAGLFASMPTAWAQLLPPPSSVDVATAPGPKVCVSEPKPTTKVVYGSVCKDYCRPKCRLLDLFRKGCGCEPGGCCGEVWTKRVLTFRSVPGRDRCRCVLKLQPPCDPPPRQP